MAQCRSIKTFQIKACKVPPSLPPSLPPWLCICMPGAENLQNQRDGEKWETAGLDALAGLCRIAISRFCWFVSIPCSPFLPGHRLNGFFASSDQLFSPVLFINFHGSFQDFPDGSTLLQVVNLLEVQCFCKLVKYPPSVLCRNLTR